MDSKNKYRLATDENGSPFVLNSKGSIDFGYWKVISGGVFKLSYSKKKKEIYSGSDNRPPQPAPDGEGFSLSKM